MSRLCSDEELEFIKENVKGKTSQELMEIFNKKFNRNLTRKQIAQIKKYNGFTSGVNTKFSKGSKPHNYKPIGSEFVDSQGYIWIKIADPNKWIHKSLFIYEQTYGNIPKGYSVIFLNGNKSDHSINNLQLIRNKEKLVMKNKHLFYENKELTKTGILIAEIINKSSEVKRNAK